MLLRVMIPWKEINELQHRDPLQDSTLTRPAQPLRHFVLSKPAPLFKNKNEKFKAQIQIQAKPLKARLSLSAVCLQEINSITTSGAVKDLKIEAARLKSN